MVGLQVITFNNSTNQVQVGNQRRNTVMVNATALVKSLFVMPTEKTYILFRIEFLVVVSTLLFLAMSIVDIFRGHFHNSILRAGLGIIDNVSDSIVLYVMGAMQTAPFKNQLFPVWAIVLVGFRHSMDFISGYGIRDQNGRRFTEWRNVMKLLGVAFLNTTRGSRFAYPLWSLWSLQVVRSYYRLTTHVWALNSVWHGKSSQLVSEYMRTETTRHDDHHDSSRPDHQEEEFKAETMEGYRYLVYGETRQHIVLKKPRYVLQIDTNPRKTRAEARTKARAARAKARAEARRGGRPAQEDSSRTTPPVTTRRWQARPLPESLITLDKIWQCDGAMLDTGSTEGNKFKDLSLAFSLSRLLRCRLEDVPLHEDSILITRRLVKLRIIDEEASRAFGVMEMEMAFINDYLNTRYPMVFWRGLPSLYLSLIMSVATIGVAIWLSIDIRRVYKTPEGEVSHVINGVNLDMLITWSFMFFLVFKEAWEMLAYFLSDWARLLLACTYVRWAVRCVRNACMEKFLSSFQRSKIQEHRWHGVLDQYVFLQSYGDSPLVSNVLHLASTGALPKKDEGATLARHINIPECVKTAIMATLRSVDITRDHLPDVIPSLHDEPRRRFRWACFQLPTSSHIILVWHIATSLCEIRFALDRGVNLSSPGFPLSALLYLADFCSCCCPPPPYLVDAAGGIVSDADLRNRYQVANSLSRYCAYLLVSKPELLPDRFLVPKLVFQETVQHARSIMKGSDDSLEKRYHRLMQEANDDQDKSNTTEETRNVVRLGAKLAKQLIHDDDKETPESLRWEILAGVWAELLVHIAPSWNTAAHKRCFESGGEFITHIWALLWHCGIQRSMFWPVDDMPKHNASASGARAPDNKNAEDDSVQPAQGVREFAAGAREIRNDQQRMLADEACTMRDGQHRSGFVNGHGNTITGIHNLGNTCYFNAVLQGLLALSQLRAKMLQQDRPAGAGPLHSELKKLFQLTSGTISCAAGAALETGNLLSIMSSVKQDFKVGVMEDSNNLLVSMIDGLINEEPTMFKSLFRGQVAEHVCSKQCEHASETTQDLDLTLPIPSQEHVSIEDCLGLYANGEITDWHCEACSAAARSASSNNQEITADEDQNEQSDINNKEEEKIYRAANIHHRIRMAPPILTIQLKRFSFVNPDRSNKLEQHVKFPEVLDMTNLMEHRYPHFCSVEYNCRF